jgi:hypothetical protein
MLRKKFLLINFILGLSFIGCGPVDNSSSLDKSLFGPAVDLSGASPLFASVRTSLMKCQNCHGSWLSLSESDFKSLGLVVAGSPDSSKIYFRNQTAPTGPGPKNMPSGGYPALTSAEIQNMADWINAL